MCGIAGVYQLDQSSRVKSSHLKSMCSALYHRGPDSQGMFLDNNFGFGMTRLKIIDLETGEQPIFNEEKSLGIVFNGEIYNFCELRKDLISQGHLFKTKSDTEVILRAYEIYGIKCLDFLRGMFAIAIWDVRERKIFLARDRVGKKPLYYYLDSKQFAFASEIKSILSLKTVNRDMDYSALNDYLRYGFISGEKSIYKNIRKLPPGCYLTFSGEGKKEVNKYWMIPSPCPVTKSLDDWLAELDWKIRDAVQCRMVSDVPMGAFLSGGIDSALIVSLMADKNPTPVKSFNIGFQEKSFDESGYAQLAAEHIKTMHYQEIMPANYANNIVGILKHFDEPFADTSALPTFLLSKFARKSVTVALSGDGGDELFGGYQRYFCRKLLQNYFHLPSGFRGCLEKAVLCVLPQSNGYRDSSAVGLLRDGVLFAQRLRQNPNDLIPIYFEQKQIKDLGYDGSQDLSEVEIFAERYKETDPVSQMMWTDFSTYLVDDLLVKVDRMSMANSLEVRCPFLDHHLIEFMATMPIHLKIKGHHKKYILKKYCQNRLPSGLIHRRKHGFSVPIGQMLRGSLRPMIEDLLIGSDMFEFLDRSKVKTMVTDYLKGKNAYSKQIWALLVLAIWRIEYRKFS